MVTHSGNSDAQVSEIYRQFYEFSNKDDPQTHGFQAGGELWALLFLLLLAVTIGLLVRQYRTRGSSLYPVERFGPLTERATGLGLAFAIILFFQLGWALYITVVHIVNGQHY